MAGLFLRVKLVGAMLIMAAAGICLMKTGFAPMALKIFIIIQAFLEQMELFMLVTTESVF